MFCIKAEDRKKKKEKYMHPPTRIPTRMNKKQKYYTHLLTRLTYTLPRLNSDGSFCHLMLNCMQSSLPGPLSEEPLGPQMANRLSFIFTVMLRTEGCDISQEDVCAHRSLARLGEGKRRSSCCISDGLSLNMQTESLRRMPPEVKSEF